MAEAKCFGPTSAAQGLVLNPIIVRHVLDEVLRKKGRDTERLAGLGFTREDLSDPSFRLPYSIASEAIRRMVIELDDPDIGLVIGMRHHIFSWGLVGLGAMACANLEEAIAFGIRHQIEAGAMLEVGHRVGRRECAIVAYPRFADVSIERVLVDGTFAALLNAGRVIWGDSLRPLRIELVATPLTSASLYQKVFQCPIRYSCRENRMVFSTRDGGNLVETADNASKNLAQRVIGQWGEKPKRALPAREAVENMLRSNMQVFPTLVESADVLDIHERTLRRQLRQEGCSYRDILELWRRSRVLEQIVVARRPPEVIAKELGFANVRSLSRAFKRWTGQALGEKFLVQPGDAASAE